MPVISSRISGWRVTDSITLPKMIPMPTPAPTAPSPPPTPSAIALPASEPAFAWAKTVMSGASRCSTNERSLVVLGDRAAEIDGRQGGEDERLEGGDQAHLEQEQRDPDREREPAEGLDAQQHGQPARH